MKRDGVTLDAFGAEHAASGRSMLQVPAPALCAIQDSGGIFPLTCRIADRVDANSTCGECVFEPRAAASVRFLSRSMLCVPQRLTSERLRPKRAPSSSAQSTRRM